MSKIKILFVEDFVLWHGTCALALGDRFSVQGAISAAAARTLLADNVYDAIIMDGYLGQQAEPNTLQLIADLLAGGFKGPIFAASSEEAMQDEQMLAGCSHKLDKRNISTWQAVVMAALAECSS